MSYGSVPCALSNRDPVYHILELPNFQRTILSTHEHFESAPPPKKNALGLKRLGEPEHEGGSESADSGGSTDHELYGEVLEGYVMEMGTSNALPGLV